MAEQNVGMLPYVTPETFNCEVVGGSGSGGGVVPVEPSDSDNEKICDYLVKASRYIRRFTRRDFLPFVEERTFSIPHRFNDLSMRRFIGANVKLDQDLLEVFTLTNADGVLLNTNQYFLIESNIWPKIEIAVKFPVYWSWNTFFGNIEEPLIRVNGIWGYHDEYKWGAWEDTGQRIGTDGIDASTKSIELTSVTDVDNCGADIFVKKAVYRIDNELLNINSVNITTKTLSVFRGIRGSTAVTHDEGAIIYRWRVVEDIKQATMQIAKIWREFDSATGGRLGVGDYTASVELGVPGDAQAILKAYIRSII